MEGGHYSLHADRRIGEKDYLVTIDKASSDCPQIGHRSRTARERAIYEVPILNEAFVTLTMGLHPLKTWVFVANITDKFILELDVLCTRYASVDLKRLVLRLDKEVPL
jgi:hypothetical protein